MRNGSGTRGMFLVNSQCLGSNLQQKDTLRKSAQFWSIQTKYKSLNSIYTFQPEVQFYIMGCCFTSEFQLQTADIDISVNAHVHTNNKHTHTHTHTHTHVHTAAGYTVHVFLYLSSMCFTVHFTSHVNIYNFSKIRLSVLQR